MTQRKKKEMKKERTIKQRWRKESDEVKEKKERIGLNKRRKWNKERMTEK